MLFGIKWGRSFQLLLFCYGSSEERRAGVSRGSSLITEDDNGDQGRPRGVRLSERRQSRNICHVFLHCYMMHVDLSLPKFLIRVGMWCWHWEGDWVSFLDWKHLEETTHIEKWTLVRGIMGTFVPPQKFTEILEFYSMWEKGSEVIVQRSQEVRNPPYTSSIIWVLELV